MANALPTSPAFVSSQVCMSKTHCFSSSSDMSPSRCVKKQGRRRRRIGRSQLSVFIYNCGCIHEIQARSEGSAVVGTLSVSYCIRLIRVLESSTLLCISGTLPLLTSILVSLYPCLLLLPESVPLCLYFRSSDQLGVNKPPPTVLYP